MLKSFKRDLFLCFAGTGFVILCALAWGSPFVGTSSRSGAVLAEARQAQAPVQAQATVFEGAVIRNGEQIFLRDNSGGLFRLDQTAESFVGKTVTITGHLETASNMIHIDHVEPAA